MKNNPKKGERRETNKKGFYTKIRNSWFKASETDLARTSKTYNQNDLQSKKGDTE